MSCEVLIAALDRLASGHHLSREESAAAFEILLSGSASDALIASFLTALRVKEETAEELVGAVDCARRFMTPLEVPPSCRPLIDTCGTGGDGSNSLNVSTAAALVVAACGVKVAKHGNRSATGNSGSAEVLAELGVAIEASAPVLVRCLEEVNITFLFAPAFHPAARHTAPVRRQLPFRTIMNLVGPLANPARPERQLIGAATPGMARLLAESLNMLGIERGLVVTSGDGLDELSPSTPNQLYSVSAGGVTRVEFHGHEFELPAARREELRVDGPSESAARLRAMFAGQHDPARGVVLANAAVALQLARGELGVNEAYSRVTEVVDSGAVARLLDRWVALSRAL